MLMLQGNQLFTCIIPSHREISEHECEVELTVPEGVIFRMRLLRPKRAGGVALSSPLS